MKRYILSVILLGVSLGAFAQSAETAAAISEKQYGGSARTIAMGNAFTALGGDIGALTINPASSGVMRATQFSLSPSINIASGSTDYLGVGSKASKTNFAFTGIGFVWCYDTGNYTGLLNFNLGFSHTRNNDFHQYMELAGTASNSSKLASIAENLTGTDPADLEESAGYDPYNNSNLDWSDITAWNADVIGYIDGTSYEYISSAENLSGGYIYIPGDIRQRFNRHTYGGADDYTVNIGANISDKLFLGANVTLTSVDMTVDENYQEYAIDPTLFDDKFSSYKENYWSRTSGAGISLKFGAIWNPVGGLRLGAAVETPTWYSLTDSWQYYSTSSFTDGSSYEAYSPYGQYSYNMTTPFRFNVGASYVFGNIGLLSVDYERADYSSTLLETESGSFENAIDDENYILKSNYQAANIFRVGGELRFVNNLSLRAGFASYGSPVKNGLSSNYISGGLGWNIDGSSSLDFAYQYKMASDYNFTLYDYEAPTGSVEYTGHKFVLTYCLRF